MLVGNASSTNKVGATSSFTKGRNAYGYWNKTDYHTAELVIFEAARSTLLAMQGDEKAAELEVTPSGTAETS